MTRVLQCVKCALPLRSKNDPVFRGTVLAKGSHRCDSALKITNQAATAARLFAEQREFVHVRFISPLITADAWFATLQEWTTTHSLVHRVLPVGGGASFVVSHRADHPGVDLHRIMSTVAEQVEALGDGPGPERIMVQWNAGHRQVTTHSSDTTTL
jgi:hypothetical protein